MNAKDFFAQGPMAIAEWVNTQVIVDDKLHISRDFDTKPGDNHAVMLFTPSMKNTHEHYHIRLSHEQARRLRDWLTWFIEDKPHG